MHISRIDVTVGLFCNRSQVTSKSGKDKKVRHQVHPSVSLFFRDDIKKKKI